MTTDTTHLLHDVLEALELQKNQIWTGSYAEYKERIAAAESAHTRLKAAMESVPGGLDYAAKHIEVLDKQIRRDCNFPKSYEMRIPPNERVCSDLQIQKAAKAAALLADMMKERG